MSAILKKTLIAFIAILLFLLAIQLCSHYFIFTSSKLLPWRSMLLLILRVIVETAVIASLLYLGFWVANNKTHYSIISNSVITAYWVFVIQYLFEFVWLFFHKDNYSQWELNNFSSLSLLNIFSIEKVPLYLIYPLQTANLWELLFIALLTVLLVKHTGLPAKKNLIIMLCAYILPLICWVAFICYTNMMNTI